MYSYKMILKFLFLLTLTSAIHCWTNIIDISDNLTCPELYERCVIIRSYMNATYQPLALWTADQHIKLCNDTDIAIRCQIVEKTREKAEKAEKAEKLTMLGKILNSREIFHVWLYLGFVFTVNGLIIACDK